MTPSLVAFCNDSMSYCRVQLMRLLPRAATSPRLQRCSEFACRMPQGVSQLHTEYYRQDPAQHPCKCALAKTRAARTRRHTQYPASDANWSRCKAPTLSRCRCRSWRGAMHVDHKLSVNNPKPTTCRSQCEFRNRIQSTTIGIQLINPASVQLRHVPLRQGDSLNIRSTKRFQIQVPSPHLVPMPVPKLARG